MAVTLAGLVPPVYGAFDVDIRDHRGVDLRRLHLHCLVTMAVDKTVEDQMEEWKREPLTPGLALRTIQLICRIILFMVYVAREMRAECHDWHIRHLGMQGERLYLINWVNTTISPRTRQYSRMKPGMLAFLKWLPAVHRNPYTPRRVLCTAHLRPWREFLEGLQSYMMGTWWPQYQGLDSLPTREDVGHLAKQLMPWQWRPWTRRRNAFLILLRSQPYVVFFRTRTNIFRWIVLFL